MTASRAAVRVDDLSITTASGHAILDGVSFELAAGSVLAVVGESGSGKSTLGLALLGHTRPGLEISAGSIEILGAPVTGVPAAEVAKVRGTVVAYVPQDASVSLNPARRIGVLLDELVRAHSPGMAKAERLKRARAVLTEVELPDQPEFLRRYVHQLSGGQQQRLGIAQALVSRPAVLVLDEPTTGLDAITQREILKTVSRTCRTHGAAAVFITHDLEVVKSIADQVLVLYAGRVAELGPVDRMTTAAGPAHPYTRALVLSAPEVDRAVGLRGIPGTAPAARDRPEGCAFHPRCPFADDRCVAERPALVQLETDRLVACHHPQREPMVVQETPRDLRTVGDTGGLSVEDLVVRYGRRPVLDGVTLRVAAGASVGLIGASGSGKTTLSRAIAGLVEPSGGTITLDGVPLARSVDRRTPEQRRAIQYIFQSPWASLNPRATVLQLLAQPARAFDLEFSRTVAAQWLDRVSLSGRVLDRRPDALSGGERQRVAIARALACDPRYLVCDEITAPLDVSVQATIVELVRDIMEDSGVGLLFVSHDLGVMRSLTDTVAIFADGACIEAGPTEIVFDDPQTPYAQTLLSAARQVTPASTAS